MISLILFINKMKLYLISLILFSTVLSIKVPRPIRIPTRPPITPIKVPKPRFNLYQYANAIEKITVNKALQIQTTEQNYIEEVSKLNVPAKVKEWVKKLNNALKKNSESNIELVYNQTIGGYARAELYYFRKDTNGYTFKYGTADVVLGPLKPYKERKCNRSPPRNRLRCWDQTVLPTYDQNSFKNYVIIRIRSAIQSKIYNS